MIGISLSDGQWSAALGALLLFTTNLLSILLASGSVLALLGLGKLATQALQGHTRRNAFIVVALGIMVVSFPLAATSASVGRDTLAEYQIKRTARNWVSQSQYEVRHIDAKGNMINVQIAGEGEPPTTSALVSALQEKVQLFR